MILIKLFFSFSFKNFINNSIKYDKSDQDFYKEVEFLTQGNTTNKYLQAHIALYPEFKNKYIRSVSTSLFALTYLHSKLSKI